MEKILIKFSYCLYCQIARYFNLIDGKWVCEECGNELIKANKCGTIVAELAQR